MAKLPKGILGPVIGKIGALTGSTWKGIPYLKRNPEQGGKRAVRSPAQLANEAKFKFINEWLVPFHPFLTIGFQHLAIRKTELAAALSENYKTVFSGTYPDITIAYDRLVISKGSLPMLTDVVVAFLDAEMLTISWNQNAVIGAVYNDQVMFVAYSPDVLMADGFVGAADRAQQQFNFRINRDMRGHALELYISVVSLDRKKISDSQYIGRIEPL